MSVWLVVGDAELRSLLLAIGEEAGIPLAAIEPETVASLLAREDKPSAMLVVARPDSVAAGSGRTAWNRPAGGRVGRAPGGRSRWHRSRALPQAAGFARRRRDHAALACRKRSAGAIAEHRLGLAPRLSRLLVRRRVARPRDLVGHAVEQLKPSPDCGADLAIALSEAGRSRARRHEDDEDASLQAGSFHQCRTSTLRTHGPWPDGMRRRIGHPRIATSRRPA